MNAGIPIANILCRETDTEYFFNSFGREINMTNKKKLNHNSDYSEFIESTEKEISNEVYRIRAEFLKTRIEKLKDRFINFFKSGVSL
jgi:hypothetical protein